jgi:hypothetical protein
MKNKQVKQSKSKGSLFLARLEEKLSAKIWVQPILVFANAYVENIKPIKNVRIVPKVYLLDTIRRSSRSGGALKLWKSKEVLAEIFPTVIARWRMAILHSGYSCRWLKVRGSKNTEPRALHRNFKQCAKS